MSETLEAPAQVENSTTLVPEQSTALGAGNDPKEAPATQEVQPEPKPQTRRETIEAAADKMEKDPEEKPSEPDVTKEAPSEKRDDAQNAGAGNPDAGKTKEETEAERQDAEKKQVKAPRRFLPKAQETWANTPNAVKSEVARLERDFENLSREGMEDRQYRQSLKDFEDYTGRSGVKLQEALKLYTDIDRHLSENPVQAIAEIMKRVGLSPEQYAQIVTQNSPQYQALMLQRRAEQQQHVQQDTPEIQQLRSQLQEEQARRLHAEVIEPFRASHPRFDELQETIAQFLNSGMIPQGLSHADRLGAAYDMAERLSPRSVSKAADPDSAVTSQTAQTANPRAGKLSIKGAPSSGSSASPVRRGKLSRREAIEAAMASADRR